MASPPPPQTPRAALLQEELLRRRRAEEALRQSEERLRLLLERGGDIVYRLRLQPLSFEYISPAALEVTGYAASEFYERPGLAFDLVHADDRPLLQEYIDAGDYSRPLALRALRRDGDVIWLEHSALSAHDLHGRPVLLEGIVREVTAYGNVLQEGLDDRQMSVEERERLMSALRRIGSATLASLDLDHVVDTLAQQVVRAGILRSLMVALVDPEQRQVRVVRNYLSFDGHYEAGIGEVRPGAHLVPSPTVSHREGERLVFYDQRIVGTTYDLDDDNITPTVARTGTFTVIDGPDERFDERFEHVACKRRPQTTSYFIPVVREGRVLAVMGTGSETTQKPEILRRIRAMQPLFEQAAIALDHAMIHGRMRADTRELHDLNRRLRDEVSRRLDAEAALRDFTARNVKLAEDERHRVARELHDTVNQLLCAVGYGLESAQSQTPQGQPSMQSLAQTRELLDRTIREVRRISADLRPGVLDDLGLTPALRSLCDELAERALPVRHDIDELPDDIPSDIAISFYRLLQEAFHHAPRPAENAVAHLRVGLEPGFLRADLTAGAGSWDTALEPLRERAALLGGDVDIEVAAGHPTLLIRLPLSLAPGAQP